ncbi:MAG: ABC transporter permease [Gemmataceae bacterium]
MTRILKSVPLIFAGLILLTVVLTVPGFRRAESWTELVDRYAVTAVLALALTPVVLTGGIDISVGSVTVFSSVVIGALWRDLGWPIGWSLAGGVLAGGLAGALNGGLVSAGVLPLVATLATRELFRGLAKRISGVNGVAGFPDVITEFWSDTVLGIPVPLVIVLITGLLTYVVVHHTWIGRLLFAIGDNETAARFAGAPVRSLKLGIYTAAGLAAGLCGAITVSKYNAAKADVEQNLELVAIACVVLGGVRVTGGWGHVGGTLLGVVTMAALLWGLNAVAAQWRDTITGAMVIGVAIGNEAAQRYATRLSAARARNVNPTGLVS